MTRYCPNCGKINPDDAFWCLSCDTNLLSIKPHETPQPAPERTESQPTMSFYEEMTYQSKRNAIIKGVVIGVIAIILITLFIVFLNWYSVSGFYGINCQFNEDFWFEGNYLNTSDGWTFTMTKIREYTLDGIVLATKTYSKSDWQYDPANIFSPIDLVIGTEDVKDNIDNYDYTITSFSNRMVSWHLHYDSIGTYNYFKSHTGNNHIIPHTEEVMNTLLQNLSVNDCVLIEGSLVNLYGTRGNEWWRWNTDTQIGNFHCEIILVDHITIYS